MGKNRVWWKWIAGICAAVILGGTVVLLIPLKEMEQDTETINQTDNRTKPQLEGISPIYVMCGQTPDYLLNVTAKDERDGNLSDDIVVESDKVNVKIPGYYKIIYRVKNSVGQVAEKESVVYVYDDFVKYACITGGYQYMPLEEENYAMAVELLRPCLVHLSKTDENQVISGSGVIYTITPDSIYIATVEHVMDSCSQNVKLTFFDGYTMYSSFDYGKDDSSDLCLFSVPITSVPIETMQAIRQVSLSKDLYENMELHTKVVSVATHWKDYEYDKIIEGEILDFQTSLPSLNLNNCFIETTEPSVAGMSGTATIDWKGQLIGIDTAISRDNPEYEWRGYHTRVDHLQSLFAKFFLDTRNGK